MKDSCNKAWARRVMDLVHLRLRLKTFGAEQLAGNPGPHVFICNHGTIVGVSAGVTYLPVKFRPWVHDAMVYEDLATASIEKTYEDQFNWLGKRLKKKVARLAAKFVCGAIAAFDPISVSRTDPSKMTETFAESLKTLEQGINLLIYPENPGEHYNMDSFRELHPAFAALGLKYYRSTGRLLSFYPTFVDPDRKRFTIGHPVTYRPDTGVREEINRIVEAVQAELVRISETD